MKSIQIGKGEVKLFLFGVNTIVWIENPTGSTKKLLEQMGRFSKFAGDKINYTKVNYFFVLATHNLKVKFKNAIYHSINNSKFLGKVL